MTTTKKKRRTGNPAHASWDSLTVIPVTFGDHRLAVNVRTPMIRTFLESGGRKHHYRYRSPQPATAAAAFANRLYDGVVLTFEDGSMHLSFKRKDRSAIRDWRHFQAIKNEIAGPDREAIEIFPPEWNLIDAANEYHLWVLPEGQGSPLGLEGRGVGEPADQMDHASYRQGGSPGARQRAWEDGLPTGPHYDDR